MPQVVETDFGRKFAVLYGVSFVAFCGGSIGGLEVLALDQIKVIEEHRGIILGIRGKNTALSRIEYHQ